MYPETPYIARITEELVNRGFLSAGDRSAMATSDSAHYLYFLLQEVCGFSIRFRFKGAFAPYSDGLENVLLDCKASDPLIRAHWDETAVKDEDVQALDKLAAVAEPPDGFEGDRPRWRSLLTAYLFLAYSPIYRNGRAADRETDFHRFYGNVFAPTEVGQVVRFVESEGLQPAGT